MRHTPREANSDVERIADLTGQLAKGWPERLEYQLRFTRHTLGCRTVRAALPPSRRRHHTCDCPAFMEARARTAHLSPLLDQLQALTTHTATGDQDTPGPAGTPRSRPPGHTEAFDLLDAITRDTYEQYAALHRALFPRRTPRRPDTIANALAAITDWAAMAADDNLDDLVWTVKDCLHRHVRSARILLGYDTPMRMLEDSVCGECGGALIVAADASTDVRCIGTPDTPSCGNRYFRWQWLDLLEGEST